METESKPTQYDVTATVISQKGTCHAGYKVGNQLCFVGTTICGAPVCLSALDCMLSSVISLRYGANYPWAPEGTIRLACPDAGSPVVFELKRIPPVEG